MLPRQGIQSKKNALQWLVWPMRPSIASRLSLVHWIPDHPCQKPYHNGLYKQQTMGRPSTSSIRVQGRCDRLITALIVLTDEGLRVTQIPGAQEKQMTTATTIIMTAQVVTTTTSTAVITKTITRVASVMKRARKKKCPFHQKSFPDLGQNTLYPSGMRPYSQFEKSTRNQSQMHLTSCQTHPRAIAAVAAVAAVVLLIVTLKTMRMMMVATPCLTQPRPHGVPIKMEGS
ncbi:hypothetical protein BCR43DRAFT_493195 [Syncephalastrum racemosum]|uniref:Uncharacterized protein n=1 Tax=Syncephalastrum racemosum TaxID=13706 RepID=A0A1X2HA98_SYNRA|nr:hypothetical protein BCR43DRAFT_493195 [Syncephalastrum racemosum]